MEQIFKNPLTNLRWYRLTFTLLNIRTSPMMSSHPISIINAIIKGVSISVGGTEDPSVIFHIKDKRHTYKIRMSDKLAIEVFFFGKDREYISRWMDGFKTYLSDPVTGRNFDILEMGEIEERTYDRVAGEFGSINIEGEISLELLPPFPFKIEKGKDNTYISKEKFIHSFESRFSRLFGKEIVYTSKGDNFLILPYYWRYTKIIHYSESQPGKTQYINGCFGNLYIKGIFRDFLPFLILGSELHIGTKLSNSQGYYKLHNEQQGYFERFFPRKKTILSCLKDVLERYDNALESLSETENAPFSEDEYAGKILREIVEDTYNPSPNIAFSIKKKGGVERMVEKLQFKDLIVQQYLLKTVSKVFDLFFEEESIGFRKGISRQKSIEMVQSAISEGYQYVIESDIEDFFPSVDLKRLSDLLDFYIPQKDALLKNLLLKSIRNGYILNGDYYNRVKGVAQGSPLSPLLANLYLDSFDEEIKKWDVRMIRYADDFIILTRNKEDAENVLSMTESFLSEIGLKIKKEKTAIRHIKEGFQFLGIRFAR